ncbi:MAG: carbohydrate kinase family protein [Gammaproteobacteria bacterium]
MTALVCGSLAYDHIMVFPDHFRNHILPDKIHILNVCFVVPEMQREFGGCAGNIAYNMKLLGADGIPMATAGKDFDSYRQHLDALGIDCRHIKVIDDAYTAQCFITTDLDDNQITSFQIGAMGRAHENKVADADGISIGIVAPDGKDGMLQHARQFAEAGIPFFFDPGQNIPILGKDELLDAFGHANWLIFNDYEWQMVENKTGLNTRSVLDSVEALIVTRGAEGSYVYTAKKQYEIPPAKVAVVNDPTGCGDAYRAGLLHGLMQDMDWETTGRIASLIGAIKIEQHGTQNHTVTPQEFADRFKQNFGYAC